MNNKLVFACALLCIISCEAFAQRELTTDSKKAAKYFDQARNFERKRQPKEALEALQQAVKEDSTFGEAHLLLARFYTMYFKNSKKSAYHYRQCVIHHPDNPMFLDALYVTARSAMSRGDYKEALLYSDKYLSATKARKPYFKDAKRIKANAEFAQVAILNPVEFKPKPLPKKINRIDLQYYPSATADLQHMYFTALTNGGDENIYRADFKDGIWSEPEYIRELNTHENEGSCFVSADGKTMIFSAVEGRVRRNMGKCDLYISHNIGGRWSEPKNIGAPVNGSTWESQPSLSADGRRLFFVTHRDGGRGRHDIWMSELDSLDQWKAPINLGDKINTEADEFTPFIHPNGKTLYFASNGHLGFGGVDLYKSELVNGEWQEPVNLGYPINNHLDQRSIFISADGTRGIFTQMVNSATQRGKSILASFELPREASVNEKSGFVKGVVFDIESEKKLQAKIELVDLANDEGISQTQSDIVNGDYMMVLTEGARYGLFVHKKGYLPESLTFDWRVSDTLQPIVVNIALQPIRSGAKVILNNLFFPSGSFDLEHDSKSELVEVAKFLKSNPDMKVTISGHTDDVGNDQNNQVLSEKRAQSVTAYLVKLGIGEGRMQSVGMGEKKPIMPNADEKGRAMNRRIEMEIQ